MIVGSHTGREFPLDTLTIYANEWEIIGSRNVSKTELHDVVRMTADGRVKPVVEAGFGLEDAEEIHRRVGAREVVGRAVIEP
ncbi:MAG: zinc-binding dehydrogenase [Acidimicrobiia bacterium]|nr:zinc-binding dehydrogenase [Acidimicrobiia bacterium]